MLFASKHRFRISYSSHSRGRTVIRIDAAGLPGMPFTIVLQIEIASDNETEAYDPTIRECGCWETWLAFLVFPFLPIQRQFLRSTGSKEAQLPKTGV